MMREIAERMRAELEASAEFGVWRVLAEGEQDRAELPADTPLVLVETASVSAGLDGMPEHACTKLHGELSVAMAAEQAEAGADVLPLRLAAVRRALVAVLHSLKRVEVERPEGLCFSVSAWCEAWQPMTAEGVVYTWKLPFVWVVVRG
jgi:hypothetical protein